MNVPLIVDGNNSNIQDNATLDKSKRKSENPDEYSIDVDEKEPAGVLGIPTGNYKDWDASTFEKDHWYNVKSVGSCIINNPILKNEIMHEIMQFIDFKIVTEETDTSIIYNFRNEFINSNGGTEIKTIGIYSYSTNCNINGHDINGHLGIVSDINEKPKLYKVFRYYTLLKSSFSNIYKNSIANIKNNFHLFGGRKTKKNREKYRRKRNISKKTRKTKRSKIRK